MYRRVRRVVAATYRGKFLNSTISCVVAIFLSATDNSTFDSEPPAAARQHCPPPGTRAFRLWLSISTATSVDLDHEDHRWLPYSLVTNPRMSDKDASLTSARAGQRRSMWLRSSGSNLHNGQVSSTLYWLKLALLVCSMYTPASSLTLGMLLLTSCRLLEAASQTIWVFPIASVVTSQLAKVDLVRASLINVCVQ